MSINGVPSVLDSAQTVLRQAENQMAKQAGEEKRIESSYSVQQMETVNTGAEQSATGSGVAELAAQAAADAAGSSSGTDTNQTLLTKANSGSELTQSELSALKELDAALYARVVKAQNAREEMRREVRENPSHAALAAYQTIVKSDGDADSDTRSLIRKTIQDEYRTVASKYDQAVFYGAAPPLE